MTELDANPIHLYPKNGFKCTPDFALRTSDARINLDTYMHLYDF